MKVLVTVATGFLGSQASKLFEEKGHEDVRLGRPGGAERLGVPPADVYRDTGDPERSRDFVYVEDALGAIEALVAGRRWDETALIATGRSTPLRVAAELVRDAAGSSAPIETPGGDLPAGENESYRGAPDAPLPLNVPLEEGVRRYVDWLKRHPASQVRAGA